MTKIPNHKFINKLKELNLRPEEVAVAVNKSANAVSRWKSGQHTPRLTPKEVVALCDLLGVSINELAELFESEDT